MCVLLLLSAVYVYVVCVVSATLGVMGGGGSGRSGWLHISGVGELLKRYGVSSHSHTATVTNTRYTFKWLEQRLQVCLLHIQLRMHKISEFFRSNKIVNKMILMNAECVMRHTHTHNTSSLANE